MVPDLQEVEDKIDTLKLEIEKTNSLLREETQFSRELQEYHSIETITISFLVALTIFSFTYTATMKLNTREAPLWYVFLFVGLVAFFLLLRHSYRIFGIEGVEKKQRTTLFRRDFAYLIYLPASFVMTWILGYIYLKYNVSSDLLEPGWIIACVVLAVVAILAFIASKHVIPKRLSKRFPRIFTESHLHHRRPLVAFFRKKQITEKQETEEPPIEVSTSPKTPGNWEDEESFVKPGN